MSELHPNEPAIPEHYTRIYLSKARGHAHLVGKTINGSQAVTTLCGIWSPLFMFGTGSQEEYEEAERRRLCRNCKAKIQPDTRVTYRR